MLICYQQRYLKRPCSRPAPAYSCSEDAKMNFVILSDSEESSSTGNNQALF